MRLQATRASVTSGGGAIDIDALYRAAGGKPTLDQRFAKDKSLVDKISGNNLITFSRASSGTYVDSDGLIKTSAVNYAINSEQVDLWALSRGSISANFAESPIGDLTADKWIPDTSSNFHFPKQVTTLSSTSSVTYSIYAKQAGYRYLLVNTTAGSASGNAGPVVDLQDGVVVGNFTATYPTTVTDAGNGWWRIVISFTGNGSNIIVDHNPLPTSTVAAYAGDNTSGVLLWGAQLEEGSTATTYIPTTSTISGAPRFDHDPVTGESLGLLIEESRTNLTTYSNTFQSFCANSTPTPTPLNNQGIAPDGTNTAWIIPTGATGFCQHNYNIPANNDFYSWTIYVKALSSDAVATFDYTGIVQINFVSVFTFSTEIFSGASNGAVAYVGNGWYKLTQVFQNNGKTLFINRTTATSGNSGKVLYWGNQIEAGAFPTSYIPTSGTTVTRAADVASITGTNFSSWYNTDESTVYFEGNVIAGAVGEYPLWSIQGGFNSINGIQMTRRSQQGSRFNHFDSGSAPDIDLNGPAWIDNSYRKLSAAIGQSSAGFADSGSLFGTDNSYQLPSASDGLDSLYLGVAYRGGLSRYNIHIKRFAYFPTRKTDQQLINMTS